MAEKKNKQITDYKLKKEKDFKIVANNERNEKLWKRCVEQIVAAIGDDKDSIEARYEDENIWLTQKMLASVYGENIVSKTK